MAKRAIAVEEAKKAYDEDKAAKMESLGEDFVEEDHPDFDEED